MNKQNPTYNNLLDAAQDLVQKNGFNAFSYKHLSETVGIKTASIHYHFPSKQDLGEAMTRRYRQKFNAVIEKIEAGNTDARVRIEQYSEQFLQTLRQGGKICLCGMLAADYSTLPETMRSEVRAFFSENQAWLTKILEQGKRKGEFNFKSDAEDVALTFFSTLEGAMLDARMFEDDSRLKRAIDCWQNALLDS